MSSCLVNMTDRLLLWIDSSLLYFGLAKSLHDTHTADVYAIFDVTDKLKKFFLTQNIVQFQNTWYYHDNISTKNIQLDLTYLEYIEKKYRINLWLLAYNERIFYQHNDFHKFTTDDILLILEQECRLFEKILDETKPDFLLMPSPNFHHDYLLYRMCKAKGIKTIILGPSRFGSRFILSQEMDKLDPSMTVNTQECRSLTELQNYLRGNNVYKDNVEVKKRFINSRKFQLKASLKFLLSPNTNIKTHYTYFGRTKLKVLLRGIQYLVREKYREYFINKNFISEIDDNDKFIYFPMNIDVEATLLINSPFYTNQLEIIKHIVKSLPVGYKLYIKDHPLGNTRGWRKISDYKQIMKLPNVSILHPTVLPEKIIPKCSLVVTIVSTAGLEAAFYEKPSIVFVDLIYSQLPSVHKLISIEELPIAIRRSLEQKVDISDLNNFVNLIHDNSFELNLHSLYMDMGEYFFYGGYLVDVEIPLQKMNLFLEKNKDKFDKLCLEHVKKIKQYKQQ